MIRINLLPFRAARKRENIKRQVTVYVLSVILLVVAMAYMFLQLDGRLSDAKAQETQLNQALAKHRKTIARINDLKKKIQVIEQKLTVIRRLEEGKQGPVRLLDELARAVPRDRLWLSAMAESEGNLTLTGSARDNETVAEFMTNLENSPIVTSVDLQSSQSTTIQGVSLSNFSLRCKVDPSGNAKETKKGG